MGDRPKKGVRTQGGKKGIHILETMGMGCWSPSGIKEVSVCVC